MAGYLDTYGADDVARSRNIKRIALALVCAGGFALALFLFLHNRTEKRVVSGFLGDLRGGNYQQAYQTFGCTPSTPCRDYSFAKFMEDWGPKGQYADAKSGRITTVDSCGGGVVLTLEIPKVEPFGLYVDRGTKVLSFAPWPRCPGRHWRFMEFLSRHFS